MFCLAWIFEAYNFNIFLTCWQDTKPKFILILYHFPLCVLFSYFSPFTITTIWWPLGVLYSYF